MTIYKNRLYVYMLDISNFSLDTSLLYIGIYTEINKISIKTIIMGGS